MKREITFHPKMYVGESMNPKKLDKIKNKLCTNPLFAKVFIITLAQNPSDQLDIFDARQLQQPHYQRCSIFVIGIASSYDEAISLVEQITKDCLRERKDCALREYLQC